MAQDNSMFIYARNAPYNVPVPSPFATTPASITTKVKKFCAEISRHQPVYLGHTDFGFSPGWCHANVAMMVQKFGGAYLPGWIIWSSAMMFEAEHHAVWHRPDQTLVDVTPRVDGEDQILFLPDPARPYDFPNSLAWENKRYLKSPTRKAMFEDIRRPVIVSLEKLNSYLMLNGMEPVQSVGAIPVPALSRGLPQKANVRK